MKILSTQYMCSGMELTLKGRKINFKFKSFCINSTPPKLTINSSKLSNKWLSLYYNIFEIQFWIPNHCWNWCPLSPGIVIISHIVIDLFKYNPGQIYFSSCCKWLEAGRLMEWNEGCLKEIFPSSTLVKRWVVNGHRHISDEI